MSERYGATFIPGTQEIVTKRLQALPNSALVIEELQANRIIFKSTLSSAQISELRFLPDVFELPSHKSLPLPGFKSRRLEPGELQPELAHIMGLLAGLRPKHTVLDPFAGVGAIARECLQGFHAETVIAIEHNEHLVPHLKSIPHLVAKAGDAARLPHITTRSIDRIITAPSQSLEAAAPEHLRHIYHEAFIQMHRVLRAKGCVIILTDAPFMPDIATEVGFALEKRYEILLPQKAQLYKLRKNTSENT